METIIPTKIGMLTAKTAMQRLALSGDEKSSETWMNPHWCFPRWRRAFSSCDRKFHKQRKVFSSKPKTTVAARVSGVGLDGEFGSGVGQAFFEGERSIAIDSDRRLSFLLWNSTLKLEVISFSFSFSQIIGGTSCFTPVLFHRWKTKMIENMKMMK